MVGVGPVRREIIKQSQNISVKDMNHLINIESLQSQDVLNVNIFIVSLCIDLDMELRFPCYMLMS